LIENYLGPLKILDLIGSVADVVISMKYHGLVFGMLCGKPVINIADSSKNMDLMTETGLCDLDLRIAGASVEAVLDAVARAPLATPTILNIRDRNRVALEPLKERLLHAYS
jgi:polysaccharide pyruvyl transferase WcaK-like protein